MPTALTIPQLSIPPVPAVRTADGPATDPQAIPATTEAPGSAPSFAAVLKAKSATQTDDPGEDASRQVAAEDAALLAVMAGVPAPLETPPAPRLLAQLKGDRLEPPPAGIAELPAALAPVTAIAADAATGATPVPTSEAPAAVPAAMAMAVAMPHSAAQTAHTTAPVALPAAVPPAPTPGPSKPAANGQAMPAVTDRATNKQPELAGSMPQRHTPLAGATANSAETGKPGGDTPKFEAASEFRPLLERMTEHTGATAPQAAPSSAAPPQQAPAVPVQVRLATPFAEAGWAQEVDQKLSWIVTTARQQADLVLNPPDLGRIEVTLVVTGDEVNASFASPHQAVREAIEESLVRLRETLAESGINLGQTHVGRDSSRDAPFVRPEGDARQARGPRQEAVIALAPASAWMPAAAGRGMVDVFA